MIRRLFLTLMQLACWTGAPPVRAQPTEDLVELRSDHGVLAATLEATEGKVHIGDLDLDGMTYNGNYAGPVLRVHPGDRLNIRLVNHLSEPTNLHFHGMRTSPLGNSDNVHLAIAAGGSFDYVVRIPRTQPIGLYWYHAHVHGASERQVMGGLSGALVVDAPGEPILKERLFVLKEMTFNDDTGNAKIDTDLHSVVQSVNGKLEANETIHPGETQLWRFTNQSADRAFHIALQGHRFRIIAEDGVRTTNERVVDVLDIAPAARAEVLVDAAEPGNYDLISKGMMTGTAAAHTSDRIIGRLVVAGAARQTAHAIPQAVAPPDLRMARIDTSRTIVFTQSNSVKADQQGFFLNGRIFDAGRVDVRAPLGVTEEWTIRNDTDDMHVFHIHQIGFQVITTNGAEVPFTGYVDTINVPEHGAVTLRLPFTDPMIIGRFMFHCHVLKHEDKGMMAQIEIYDPAANQLSARLSLFWVHLWWWLHGVPWSLCGLASA